MRGLIAEWWKNEWNGRHRLHNLINGKQIWGKKKKVNRAQGPMGLYLLLDNKSVIIDMDEKDEV